MRCLYLFLDPEGPPSVSVVATSRGTMNLPAIADFASCDAQLSWSDRPRFERDSLIGGLCMHLLNFM